MWSTSEGTLVDPQGSESFKATDHVAPEFIEQPERQFLKIGQRLEIGVKLKEEGALLQWHFNGEPLEGETEESLVIESVTLEDGGKYYITATNTAGTTYSEHARVSVSPLYLDKSVARQWMEELLEAIRQDYPAPTVHSRNLFSLSTAMWDAWAAYDASGDAVPYIAHEDLEIPDDDVAVKEQRNEAISFAAYRVLRNRFRFSPSVDKTLPTLRERMELLGYDADDVSVSGTAPAAVGNRIANKVLAHGWSDGANELHEYEDQTGYRPVNRSMIVVNPGTEMVDPNAWQPLALDFLVLQNGIKIGTSVQEFLGPNWGWVTPFALVRDTNEDVYQDPGPPPYLGTETDQAFKDAAMEVIEYSSWLDPVDPTVIDVSPGARHNNPLGTNDGTGYPENPYTGEPYETNMVLRADYGRILAEFWADGPDSETPPGHWNSVANYVSDNPLFEKRFEGEGPLVDDLEWDVKLYFAMNAAVSDAAIASWDAKRKYNYPRPISMIRYMGGKGQSSDADGPSYDPEGLPLKEGLIEVITEASSADGERHAHLSEFVGEITIFAWQGEPENANTENGGVGWIRAVEWVPYQRSTFVTPPFGAYTSGHSTFSRAGAEVLAAITGDKYFPGGISSFSAKAHEFLEFESGPEEDVTLTWATYYDAADEAGISRLYGGIHVWADDLNGRIMGSNIGIAAYEKAKTFFNGTANALEWDEVYEDWVGFMTADSSQVSEREYYLEDEMAQLSRFFLGASPFPEGIPGKEPRLIFLFNNRNPGVELFQTNGLVEFETKLQVSFDLTDWTDVPDEDLISNQSNLDDGTRRVRMYHVSDPELLNRQFLRVKTEEKY